MIACPAVTFSKVSPEFGENNGSARFCLVASDNDIDVEWIELDAAAHPPGTLRGDESLILPNSI